MHPGPQNLGLIILRKVYRFLEVFWPFGIQGLTSLQVLFREVVVSLKLSKAWTALSWAKQASVGLFSVRPSWMACALGGGLNAQPTYCHSVLN